MIDAHTEISDTHYSPLTTHYDTSKTKIEPRIEISDTHYSPLTTHYDNRQN